MMSREGREGCEGNQEAVPQNPCLSPCAFPNIPIIFPLRFLRLLRETLFSHLPCSAGKVPARFLF